jgi:LysM repeat protein
MKIHIPSHFLKIISTTSILLGLSGCATLQSPFKTQTKGLHPEDTLSSANINGAPSSMMATSPSAVRAAPIRPIWYYSEPKEEPQPLPEVKPLPTPEPAKSQTSYVIQKGDTLCGIARRFQIPLQKLLEENLLEKSTPIFPGQRIILPGIRTEDLESLATNGQYKIKPGDTLFTIAKRYGLSVAALKKANNLHSERIFTGQTLRIPHRGEIEIFPQKKSFPNEKNQPIAYSRRYSDGTYVVQRGDSLFSIAKKFGIPFSELQAINNISNPRNLQIGQTLIIPQEVSSSIMSVTTITQTATTNKDTSPMASSISVPVTSEAMAPPAQGNYPYQFMDDVDFYKEDIDKIPVVQIKKE